MTDEIDVMKKAITQFDRAIRLKNINEELFDHLLGSVIWLVKYSEKYGIPLPKREDMHRMLKRAEFLISEMDTVDATHFSTPKNDTPEDDKTIIIIA